MPDKIRLVSKIVGDGVPSVVIAIATRKTTTPKRMGWKHQCNKSADFLSRPLTLRTNLPTGADADRFPDRECRQRGSRVSSLPETEWSTRIGRWMDSTGNGLRPRAGISSPAGP